MSTGKPTATPHASRSTGRTGHRVWGFVRRNWWLFTAVVVGVHLLAWTVSNPQRQEVNWILFTSNSPVGLVITVAVVLGALLALLISRQRQLGNPDARTAMPRRRPGPAGRRHKKGSRR